MTLDELLLEWSYRSDKGYPDMDNPSDISILKEILEQLDLPTDDILDKVSYANKDGKPGITGSKPSTPDLEGLDPNPPLVPGAFAVIISSFKLRTILIILLSL